MAVIRADLAGLPASHGEVTLGYFAEDLFNMVLGIPLLLTFEAEDVHGDGAPGEIRCSLAQSPIRQERAALRIARVH